MNHREDAPVLPKWPFLIGDVVLIGAAVLIAVKSPGPLGTAPLVAIVSCVALGAALAAIPFIAAYARRQDELLTERQNQIAALARTTAESAEQLSIAAASLHGIAEQSAKHLKLAEQLPHKLQERINDLKQSLAEVAVAENETLQQEINTLRAAEAEKLETAADKISRATADFTQLEAATQQQLLALRETLARLPSVAEQSSQLAAKSLEQMGARLRTTLADSLAQSAVLAQANLERSLAAAAVRATGDIESSLGARIGALERARDESAPAHRTPVATTSTFSPFVEPPRAAFSSLSTQIDAETKSTPLAIASPEPSTPPAATLPPPPAVADEPPARVATTTPPAGDAAAPLTPAEESPAAPAPASDADTTEAVVASTEVSASPGDEPSVDEPKPAKARAKKAKPAPETEPGLGLDFGPESESGTGDREDAEVQTSLSIDGATRLVVTAYIGIGNKLFIRGDGPGLDAHKGVPLQFVSIGKWRWETNDANAPIRAKLYKNDQVECASVGQLTLEPAHQHEVTARF